MNKETDNETCPHCNNKIRNLWEYPWNSPDDEIEMWRGNCAEPITLRREVDVHYYVSIREE